MTQRSPTLRPGSGAPPTLDRRTLLKGTMAAAAGVCGYTWWKNRHRPRSAVFLARGQRYDGDLEQTIADGLAAVGLRLEGLAGKRVLLKPNLVEPTRSAPHMTTHPAMIVATAEVFRRHGASVTVGEGPGHVRDTELILDESGVGQMLDEARLDYVDLNYEDVG